METLAHFHFQTVHFPIALSLACLLFMLIHYFSGNEKFYTAASYVLYLAALGAILSVSTGLIAEDYLPHSHEGEAHQVMELHETLGLITLGILILASILNFYSRLKNKVKLKPVVMGMIFIACTLVGMTGFFGGRLGHEFGIGLKTMTTVPSDTSDHHHDHHDDD